ncbi:hypothetical protein ACIA6E_20055 [Streptomyces sp. NPDC051815]|uniref:hypothetical protein n=1 Tax=Streptomyces sp. NPDC051815 TaxID=3365674 RepID=UPI00379B3A4A
MNDTLLRIADLETRMTNAENAARSIAGTGGTPRLRWAHTSTQATPTIVKTDSVLQLTRVA